MKVQEVFIKGKSPDASKCEDGYVITDHFIAVFDGATASSNNLYDGMTTGRYAMTLLCEAVKTMKPEATFTEAAEHLTNAIRSKYIEHGILEQIEKEPNQRFTAVTAIYSKYHQQIWLIGDGQVLVNGEHHDQALTIEDHRNGPRSFILQEMLKNGKITQEEVLENDPTWDSIILPKARIQYHFQNAKEDSFWNYSALDGTSVDLSKTKIIDVSAASEIVLASDGYPILIDRTPILKTTLAETEKALANINHRDPMCIYENVQAKCNKPGNNSFDDRTYIRFTL